MTTVHVETITAGDYPVTVQLRAHELRADLGAELGGADSAPGAHDYFDAALRDVQGAHRRMWYAKRKASARAHRGHRREQRCRGAPGHLQMHVKLASTALLGIVALDDDHDALERDALALRVPHRGVRLARRRARRRSSRARPAPSRRPPSSHQIGAELVRAKLHGDRVVAGG